jgi:hypothetical protein
MSKQYLHLSAYRCHMCAGPVIAGWFGVRENAISKETDIRQVGAICLSCGHKQQNATDPMRHLMPMEWDSAGAVNAGQTGSDLVEALNRAELH